MTSDSARVRVMVSVDPDRLREVARACREVGLDVEQETELGILFGTAPADALALLEAVDGVEAVERERSISLPPPDSEVQ